MLKCAQSYVPLVTYAQLLSVPCAEAFSLAMHECNSSSQLFCSVMRPGEVLDTSECSLLLHCGTVLECGIGYTLYPIFYTIRSPVEL